MAKPWKRLGPWLPGGDTPDDGAAALRALADVTEARRALEQAELSAVRVARRHGRSWTEIATMLAMTRQSAWERWRDLDDDAAGGLGGAAAGGLGGAAAGGLGGAVESAASAVVARATRRRRTVAVPDLVGFTAAEALGILTGAGLGAVSATPDVDLLDTSDTARPATVVRQYPDPGTRIPTASTVRLWLERGDGEAGVREPRRPSPPPRAARAEEAVG